MQFHDSDVVGKHTKKTKKMFKNCSEEKQDGHSGANKIKFCNSAKELQGSSVQPGLSSGSREVS